MIFPVVVFTHFLVIEVSDLLALLIAFHRSKFWCKKYSVGQSLFLSGFRESAILHASLFAAYRYHKINSNQSLCLRIISFNKSNPKKKLSLQ